VYEWSAATHGAIINLKQIIVKIMAAKILHKSSGIVN